MAASCGSDEAVYAPVTPSIVDFVKTICSAAFTCCSQGEVGWYLGTFLTSENCVDRLSEGVAVRSVASFDANILIGQQAIGPLSQLSILIPNLGSLDRAMRDGRTTVDMAALAKCEKFLKSLKGESCNQPAQKSTDKTCKPEPEPPPPGDCDPMKIYIGTLAEGDPCTSDGRSFECGPGLICVRNGALGQTGQCVREGKVGDYCLEDASCAQGLYCSMLDGTCQEPQKAGEPCEYADHLSTTPSEDTLLVMCRKDLECDPVTDTCVIKCQEGHSCTSTDDCDKEKGLKCIANRCDLPRGEGLPCTVDANCTDELYCGINPAKPGKRVCRAREADGTPCVTGATGSTTSRQCIGFCNQRSGLCEAQVFAGDPCPTGQDEQCDHGYCSPTDFCTADADCPQSTCDLTSYQCVRKCIASKPEGAPCTLSNECAPLDCIANHCRELPLTSGTECETDSECESKFCNLDTPRVCQDLPLELGAKCTQDDQCSSGVCFGDGTLTSACTAGREEGELCGNSQLPCDPDSFYCDLTLEQPRCTAYRETGEECSSDAECRSRSCATHMQRKLCSPKAARDKAICDGL
jgi:hypothetical protein